MIEYGIIAKLRFELDLYVNLRPVRCYDDRMSPLKGKGPNEIDMVFVRENTEGAYCGSYGYAHKNLAMAIRDQRGRATQARSQAVAAELERADAAFAAIGTEATERLAEASNGLGSVAIEIGRAHV